MKQKVGIHTRPALLDDYVQEFGIFLPQRYFCILKLFSNLDHKAYFSLTKMHNPSLRNQKGYELCQSPWVMNSFTYDA